MYADKNWIDRLFQEEDLVYLRLQSYRKYSLKKKGAKKLHSIFYGPHKILKQNGEVTYQLEILGESKIHNVFHVSCLNKAIFQQIVASE